MRVTDRDEDVPEIVTEKPVKVVVSCCFMGKGRSSVLRVTQVPADFELFFSFNSCAREGATNSRPPVGISVFVSTHAPVKVRRRRPEKIMKVYSFNPRTREGATKIKR